MPDKDAGEQLTVADVICPQCNGSIINHTMFEPRDGQRRYCGWCAVCAIGVEVEQQWRDGQWQIVRYRVPMKVTMACEACRVEADWRAPTHSDGQDTLERQRNIVMHMISVFEDMVKTLRGSIAAMGQGNNGR